MNRLELLFEHRSRIKVLEINIYSE